MVQPRFQRLAGGADRARADRSAVIMGVDQHRQRQQRLGHRAVGTADRCDVVARDLDPPCGRGLMGRARDQVGAGDGAGHGGSHRIANQL
jgi:hypothetical protein